MQFRLLPAPSSVNCSHSFSLLRSYNRNLIFRTATSPALSRRRISVPSAVSNNHHHQQDHYAVLGVSADASAADIKKAYRLLARKMLTRIRKLVRCSKASILHMRFYLITQQEADMTNHSNINQVAAPPWRTYSINLENEIKSHRWSSLRQKMKYHKRFDFNDYFDVTNGRGSFIDALRSAFLSIFLLKTIGAKLSLTFSSVTALLDPELDGGYKVGYLVAWMLGGRNGILLTLCLSFANWVCGKANGNVVAQVAVSMWVGSNLARFAPIPQGAILTLLYMSIKLQADLN